MTNPADCGTFPHAMCDHLFDTTTRYDRDAKLLTFVMLCPICGVEKMVIETVRYAPAFKPTAPFGTAGAAS